MWMDAAVAQLLQIAFLLQQKSTSTSFRKEAYITYFIDEKQESFPVSGRFDEKTQNCR